METDHETLSALYALMQECNPNLHSHYDDWVYTASQEGVEATEELMMQYIAVYLRPLLGAYRAYESVHRYASRYYQ